MVTKTREVRGKVTMTPGKKGIHGVTVRLGPGSSAPSTLTHADGTFELRVPRTVRTSRTALDFLDRDGKLLLRRKIPANDRVDVGVDAGKLEAHFSRPLSVGRLTGRVLPAERLDALAGFLNRLPPARRAQYAMLLGERPCPFPPIDRFEDLIGDAWDTLGGDPLARQRFKDVIDILVSAQPDVPPRASLTAPRLRSVETVIKRLSDELKVSTKRWATVETLLGRDALLPLIFATAHVYGDNGRSLDRGLRTVLGHLDAYRGIAALVSAAENALTDGERAERHVQAIFGLFDDLCGVIEDFPPPFGLPELDGGDLERLEDWGCTAEAALALARIRGAFGFPPEVPPGTATYRIDRQSPTRICERGTITLHGEGFTDEPGLVRFSGGSSLRGAPIDVAPVSWSDSEVVVRVPEGAACGPLELRIVEQRLTVSVCDSFLDFSTYREAEEPFEFESCRPVIGFLGLDDVSGCATVGSERRVSWRIEPEDADVTLEFREGDGPMQRIPGAAARGSTPVDTSHVATYVFVISANNPRSACGNETRHVTVNVGPPPPSLEIRGVELTQGIQRFSLTDTADNNSVALIANMDTIVRVFVASDRGAGFAPESRVGGRLYCRGRLYTPVNGSPRGSSPVITAGPDPQRANTDDSLNFLIPAGRSAGSETLHIEVFPIHPCDGDVITSLWLPITWAERPAFPVTIRRIADAGTGAVISEDDVLDLIDQAFDLLPSPRTAMRLRDGVFTLHEGTTEANYCRDGGFYQLALSVAYEHNGVEGLAPDPHETAWVGVFFATGCPVAGMMSWPWTSTCITERDRETAAHEIAHTAGMGHTVTFVGEGCEDVSQPVACHRLPNDGLLTDVAFDVRNNVAVPGCADLMSYRPERKFLHPDHWEHCRNLMDGRF